MLTPPQRSNLPQLIEPRRLVNQGVTLTGNIDGKLCVRFADAVIEISEPIEAELIFDVADQGRKVVHIIASTTVLVMLEWASNMLEDTARFLVLTSSPSFWWVSTNKAAASKASPTSVWAG